MWFMRLVYAGVYAVYLKAGHFSRLCCILCGTYSKDGAMLDIMREVVRVVYSGELGVMRGYAE